MNNSAILNYKDWLVSVSNSTSLADPYNEYLTYVNEWYDYNFAGKSTEDLTKEEYTRFLISLKEVSSDKGVTSFIANMNYANDNELEASIPHFAKNLRDIANYISKRRDTAKRANCDYSYLGSNMGLEMEVYRKLLETYVSNSNYNASELLSLVENASIEIEELYDDNEYMDKSPNKVANDYFNMDLNGDFYSDISPEYLNWILESGFNDLYSNNDNINPPVSGNLPLSGYIAFDEDSEQTLHFKGNLATNLLGEEQFFLSGSELGTSMHTYSNANLPWNNLSNRYFPTIANFPLIDSVYSKYTVGGFLIPSKIGMGIALGKNKYYKDSELVISGTKDNFPNPTVYSNGYSFTTEYQDASIVYNSYLNWIDIKQVSGRGKGILTSNGKYQEMTPYQTTQETTKLPFLGMDQVGDKTDPWYLSEDKVWEDSLNNPPDFRNIYDIDAWYSLNVGISGEYDHWGIDMYGNNYGLYKETASYTLADRRLNGDGCLYIRTMDGNHNTYVDYFNEELGDIMQTFNINKLRRFEIYNDVIFMEDDVGRIMAQRISFSDGNYTIMDNSIDVLGDGEFFDHFYDDRTNTLYVGRYEIEDGFVEIVIYKYYDGRFMETYNTRKDNSIEIKTLRKTYTFVSVNSFPSITISPIDDKMFLSYMGDANGTYTVIIPLSMTSGLKVTEIIVVQPVGVTPSTELYATEALNLINTMISNDNLILLLEGNDTANKYLQSIQL